MHTEARSHTPVMQSLCIIKKMSWNPTKKEQSWALSLSSDDRYAYAVDKIRDHGEIWSLKSENGWVLGCDPKGNPVFPIWPHEKYAVETAIGDWCDSYPEMIPIEKWINEFSNQLKENNTVLGVMMTPGPNSTWVPVPVNHFSLHLQGPRRKKYKPIDYA